MKPDFSKPSVIRTLLTLVFSIFAAYGLFELGGNPPIAIFVSAGLLVLAPFAARSHSLGWQIAARALWLQIAILGLLALIDLSGDDWFPLLIGAGGALVVAGKKGLDGVSNLFAPVAFRKTLLASMIFGIADFSALMLYTGVFAEEYIERFEYVSFGFVQILALAGAALAMAISIRGLYKMKMWGLIACVISNVAVATMALTGVFDLPDILTYGLVSTAIIQILLPIPLVTRMVRSVKVTA